MKEILGVHYKTPNAACSSELARQPYRTKIITACIKYFDHVISSKDRVYLRLLGSRMYGLEILFHALID